MNANTPPGIKAKHAEAAEFYAAASVLEHHLIDYLERVVELRTNAAALSRAYEHLAAALAENSEEKTCREYNHLTELSINLQKRSAKLEKQVSAGITQLQYHRLRAAAQALFPEGADIVPLSADGKSK